MSALSLALTLVAAAAPAQGNDNVLRSYANCATKRETPQMQAMLDARSEAAYRSSSTEFSEDAHCGSRDEVTTAVVVASFNQDRGKLRGMVAESLLKRSAHARQLAPLAKNAMYRADWFAMTGRIQVIDEMAMCVAAINPAGVLAVLATKPNSSAQQQAFNSLTPSLGACLAGGYQLDTKPTALRAALAEALYHRDRDGDAASSGKGA